MKSESPDSGDAQSEKVTSLRDSDIVSSRAYGRRGLLQVLGVTLLGAGAIIAGSRPAQATPGVGRSAGPSSLPQGRVEATGADPTGGYPLKPPPPLSDPGDSDTRTFADPHWQTGDSDQGTFRDPKDTD